MKILYAGTLSPHATVVHRQWALERLGHRVVPVDVGAYASKNALLQKLAFHLSVGQGIDRFNRDVLRIARDERPDLFWGDKMLWLRPSTLEALRAMGIALVSYLIDNPFGERGDSGWRLYLRSIPLYDLHVVQRERNLVDYREHSARDVLKIQTAYEPTLHFPPPSEWTDQDRSREVSFIGTPYDDRAAVLTRLWRSEGFAVSINGSQKPWRRALDAEAFAALYRMQELYGGTYREAIWQSKINLSFVTHANHDEFAHKSFEIAGCRGFLLAERSAGHAQRFAEDEEAVFFSSFEELSAKIRRYLPDEAARARIAAAGRARAVRDGYDNDQQVGLVMERAVRIVEALRNGRTPASLAR